MSVANLFRGAYRTSHEGRYVEAIEMLNRRRAGTLSDADVARWLRRRDALLWAECESAHILCWFTDVLPGLFPEARFVVTVRDVFSWTNSVIDQHLNTDPPASFKRLRDLYFGARSTAPGSPLTDLGEFDLEGYVGYWADHYAFLLDHLPPDRTLYIWMRDLGERVEDIAAFAGVPPSSLDPTRSHSHAAPEKHRTLSRLDANVVRETIQERAGPTAEQLQMLPGLAGKDLLGLPARG